MKDQRWANRPDAVARRPKKRQRIVLVVLAFVLVAAALSLFEWLGANRSATSLNPTSEPSGGREAAAPQ